MLDDAERILSCDPGGMIAAISRFPELIEIGYKLATNINMEMDRKFRGLYHLGIGGSAIGGDVIRDWIGREISGGVRVERGTTLLEPVGEGSLVVCCSYSGNTIETISLLTEVMKDRSGGILLVTSDGALAETARERGIPLIMLEQGLQPRASLPMVVSVIATICDRVGWTRKAGSELLAASEFCSQLIKASLEPGVPTDRNPAKQVAHQLYGLIPVVISPFNMESVARRWKTQMNENAKHHCFYGTFPEMSHNEIVPWQRDTRSSAMIAVLLRDLWEDSMMSSDLDRLRDAISSHSRVLEVRPLGRSRIEAMMGHILLGDFASVYLAMLSGVDPSPVGEIEEFKRRRRGP